jgi:hypothetical protein
MNIAILGARGTGKSWLAAALKEKFPALSIVESCLPLESAQFNGVLLMGLDLPYLQTKNADGDANENANDAANSAFKLREDQDAALRQSLHKNRVNYSVIYGLNDARLANAAAAIQNEFAITSVAGYACSEPVVATISSKIRPTWSWPCDKCSDPECEHKLFTQLLR